MISCTIARTMETTKFDHPGKRAKIVSLIKESGERVVFSGYILLGVYIYSNSI